jgi:single-strand DNA-binding protein
MYLNKAILVGNITKDPELKALESGVKVVNFGLATNRTWKDKNGNKQEKADFHNIVAFGKTAEIISQYCKKGNQILVEGRIETRSWEKDGKTNYRTEIMVESFQFGNNPKKETSTQEPEEYKSDVVEEVNPEEIPF